MVGGWQEGVGIQLNVPLFHGGANLGNLAAANADISQALERISGNRGAFGSAGAGVGT